jgi:hypothetical protein
MPRKGADALAVTALLGELADGLIDDWARHRGGHWLAFGAGVWLVSVVLMGLLFRHSTLSFCVVVVLLVLLHLLQAEFSGMDGCRADGRGLSAPAS